MFGGCDQIVPDDFHGIVRSRGRGGPDFWIRQNGCSATTTPSFNGCVTDDGCPEGKPVVYCLGDWDHTIDSHAVATIWAFFDALP